MLLPHALNITLPAGEPVGTVPSRRTNVDLGTVPRHRISLIRISGELRLVERSTSEYEAHIIQRVPVSCGVEDNITPQYQSLVQHLRQKRGAFTTNAMQALLGDCI